MTKLEFDENEMEHLANATQLHMESRANDWLRLLNEHRARHDHSTPEQRNELNDALVARDDAMRLFDKVRLA